MKSIWVLMLAKNTCFAFIVDNFRRRHLSLTALSFVVQIPSKGLKTPDPVVKSCSEG
jgi:hypothetical protein